MTVVATVKFQDKLTTGKRTRETDSTHRRFRPGIHESDLFDIRQGRAEEFGKLDFEIGRRSEACASIEAFKHSIPQECGIMSENERTPRKHVIDVTILVRVVKICAISASNEKWLAAHLAKGAHRTVHATGNYSKGTLKESMRPTPGIMYGS